MIGSAALPNRVDRLAARGLVTREAVPGDRRCLHNVLTEEGRKPVDRAESCGEEGLRAARPPLRITCVTMKRPWTPPILLVLCGLVVAAGPFREGDPGIGAAVVAAFAVLAALNSPLIHPRSISASEAAQRSERDGRPIVYWRPGCAYCLRLRLRLGRGARRLHWVDIWRDPDGAAAVRAANGGDETVPTVVVSGRPYVNPDPAWVRDQLSSSA